MLGIYDNFPFNVHRIENLVASLSNKKLQERIIQILHDINLRNFSFERIAYPTVPNCTIIFEVGLAEGTSFNYIDEEETKKIINILKKVPFDTMDFFLVLRYYKGVEKAPLKFDYYFVRLIFKKNSIQTQIFHERGPRYLSPEDIMTFLIKKINEAPSRRIIRRL